MLWKVMTVMTSLGLIVFRRRLSAVSAFSSSTSAYSVSTRTTTRRRTRTITSYSFKSNKSRLFSSQQVPPPILFDDDDASYFAASYIPPEFDLPEDDEMMIHPAIATSTTRNPSAQSPSKKETVSSEDEPAKQVATEAEQEMIHPAIASAQRASHVEAAPKEEAIASVEGTGKPAEGKEDDGNDDSSWASAWSAVSESVVVDGGDSTQQPKTAASSEPTTTTITMQDQIDDWYDQIGSEQPAEELEDLKKITGENSVRAASSSTKATKKSSPDKKADLSKKNDDPPFATKPSLSSRDIIPENYVHAAFSDRAADIPTGSGTANVSLEDRIFQLEHALQKITQELKQLHNNKEINWNAPKQVALAIFGDASQSTAKSNLEGIAAHNPLAAKVLEYRSTKAQLSKLVKKQEAIQKGVRVSSVTKAIPKNKQTKKKNDDDPDNNDDSNDDDPLLLVDTSAFIFRAYYSMPPMHRSRDGMPTGAVLGFCNMLNRLVLNSVLDGKQQKPPRLVLCLDAPGPNFRHDLYDQYKAHRQEAPIDLIPQFALIRQAAAAFGIPTLQASGYEADDVIATLCQESLHTSNSIQNTLILSGDKDLMQLITGNDNDDTTTTTATSIAMLDPMTMTRMDATTVQEKWGIPPEKLGDLLALAGDSADNIPGVPGIGPKIASQLLQEYGTLEKLFDHVDDIKQKARKQKLIENQEQAWLSRRLVELERHIPHERLEYTVNSNDNHNNEKDWTLEDLRMEPFDAQRVLDFYTEMGFYTIRKRLEERLERLSPERQEQLGWNGNRKTASSTSAGRTQRASSKYSAAPSKSTIPKPEEYADVPF